MTVLVLLAFTAASSVAGFGLLLSRLLSRVRNEQGPGDWLDEFSVDVYRPMERLLEESDYIFLSGQPGYHRTIARELRAERRAIFRTYLGQLVGDFNALLRIGRLMLVYAPRDNPEFARALSRARNRFYWAVAKTELCLTFAPHAQGSIPVARLIESLDHMWQSVQHLTLEHGLLQQP